MGFIKRAVGGWFYAACILITATAAVAAEQPFYRGKTLTIIAVDRPGGTGDLRTRAVTQYLQKHLPGNPPIVFQYITNDVLAANTLAHTVKRDGLTIGRVNSSVYANAIFGVTGVKYKLDDFVYFGGAEAGGPYLLMTRPGANLDTVEKLKAQGGLRFANRTVGHTMYILDRVMAFVLELKDPKWVLGYDSQEIRLALSRGEADLRANSVPSFIREVQDLRKEGYGIPFIMKNVKGRGAEMYPDFPQDRPGLEQFADSPLKKALLQFHNSIRPSGTVFVAPKGIPEPAMKALREAFNKTWTDPDFLKEFERITREKPDPVTEREVEETLAQRPRDPRVQEIYEQIIGGGPLPAGGR